MLETPHRNKRALLLTLHPWLLLPQTLRSEFWERLSSHWSRLSLANLLERSLVCCWKWTMPNFFLIDEPPLKLCRKGRHWMNWRTNGALTKQKSGNYTYRSVCNGVCLKVHHSVPVKMKVSIGERCHNPRCSGVDPTFIWDENQKLYCGKICIDGYQKWHDAQGIMVSDLLHHFSSHFDPQIGSMVDYGPHFFEELH